MNITTIARGGGYKQVYSVDPKNNLIEFREKVKIKEGPIFLEVKVKKGNRKDLGRPTTTPIQNKEALMDFLNK